MELDEKKEMNEHKMDIDVPPEVGAPLEGKAADWNDEVIEFTGQSVLYIGPGLQPMNGIQL